MVMEQLTEDAVQAKKHGLSYGQYIQKFKPPKPPAERYPKKKVPIEKSPESVEQKSVVRCAVCGAEIPNAKRNRKYCCGECADIAISRQRNESQRRRKEAREAEQRRGEG